MTAVIYSSGRLAPTRVIHPSVLVPGDLPSTEGFILGDPDIRYELVASGTLNNIEELFTVVSDQYAPGELIQIEFSLNPALDMGDPDVPLVPGEEKPGDLEDVFEALTALDVGLAQAGVKGWAFNPDPTGPDIIPFRRVSLRRRTNSVVIRMVNNPFPLLILGAILLRAAAGFIIAIGVVFLTDLLRQLLDQFGQDLPDEVVTFIDATLVMIALIAMVVFVKGFPFKVVFGRLFAFLAGVMGAGVVFALLDGTGTTWRASRVVRITVDAGRQVVTQTAKAIKAGADIIKALGGAGVGLAVAAIGAVAVGGLLLFKGKGAALG